MNVVAALRHESRSSEYWCLVEAKKNVELLDVVLVSAADFQGCFKECGTIVRCSTRNKPYFWVDGAIINPESGLCPCNIEPGPCVQHLKQLGWALAAEGRRIDPKCPEGDPLPGFHKSLMEWSRLETTTRTQTRQHPTSENDTRRVAPRV